MIEGLDHVNISTARLEETMRFFTEVLDFSLGYRPDFSFPGYWLYRHGRPIVHLVGVEPARRPSIEAALDHVAFEIADPDALRARLTANGVTFSEVDTPDGRVKQFFLTEPSGVRLEFDWRGRAMAAGGE